MADLSYDIQLSMYTRKEEGHISYILLNPSNYHTLLESVYIVRNKNHFLLKAKPKKMLTNDQSSQFVLTYCHSKHDTHTICGIRETMFGCASSKSTILNQGESKNDV
jgi:hypothetical protein